MDVEKANETLKSLGISIFGCVVFWLLIELSENSDGEVAVVLLVITKVATLLLSIAFIIMWFVRNELK